ncbi:LexA family transcriptional regulator [Helicobacter winghamensis]|uniref:XRE family transcriptional regulator n=1 Tax=Helicobacter winghamensis TaxID=157268 RepID=UPI0027A0A5D7
MDIGKKIRQAREEQGYSQEQLANELGITTRTLQNYEYGKSDVGVILITKIANILKINSDYFFKECSSPIVRQNNKNIVRQSFANSKNLSPSPTNLKKNEQDNFYLIPKLDISASAGSGNELEGLECYESGQMLAIDKVFFKTIPMGNIKAIKVDGYSMVPMLLPDSWVIFEEGGEFKGDGLYIINYANQLMVKLLQLNPFDNILEIISVNKDYKSYQFHISETQELMLIKGRVLRAII